MNWCYEIDTNLMANIRFSQLNLRFCGDVFLRFLLKKDLFWPYNSLIMNVLFLRKLEFFR